MVQIIHDLDLILHDLLPKTQAQTDRCKSRSRQTDTVADIHGHTHTDTHTDTVRGVSCSLL